MNIDSLYELCETLGTELDETTNKIRKASGKMSAGDLETVDKLAHALKSIKTVLAMEEGWETGSNNGGYSSRGSYENGGSRNSGYSRRGQRRDSMGRYTSRAYMPQMMEITENLREMMPEMEDNKRRTVERLINELERNS